MKKFLYIITLIGPIFDIISTAANSIYKFITKDKS